MTQPSPHFSATERDTLYQVLHARRDMQHFLPNTSIDELLLQRLATARAMGVRDAEFMRLKVEGIRECAELFTVELAPDGGTVFGRSAMPQEMALCSAVCAIQNLGPVHEFYPRPMLEQLDWRQGKALSAVLMEDGWQGGKT